MSADGRHHDGRHDQETVIPDEITGADDDLGDQRQLGAESREHGLELGDEKNHQVGQHAQGQQEQDGRVEHGRHHLALEFLFPHLKLGDLVQDHIEEAARFAGLDHGGVDLWKNFWGLGHGVGEGDTINDLVVNFLPLGLGDRAGSFLHQNDQRPAQGEAGRKQTGQKPGEVFQILGGDFLRREQVAIALALVLRGGTTFSQIHGVQALGLQFLQRGLATGGFERAFGHGAVGGDGFVLEERHGSESKSNGGLAGSSLHD